MTNNDILHLLLSDPNTMPSERLAIERLLTATVEHHRAYELIGAAEVTKSLPAECNQKITNENQVAALAKVEPEKRVEVLQTAVESAELGKNCPLRSLLEPPSQQGNGSCPPFL